MSYEKFREQCAKAAEDADVPTYTHCQVLHDDGGQLRSDIAAAIRALPLPEVTQEPIGYFRGDKKGNLFWTEDCVCADPVYPCASDDVDDHGEPTVSIPIYTLPPDAEALRKENEQLREKQQRLERLLSDDGYAISFQAFGQYRTALIKSMKGGAA